MDQSDVIDARHTDERDELIAALTEQLEYAAEQLDRYQRAGAPAASASARTSTSAGISPELNEGLTRFLEQWDQMQAGFTLGRIEVQLEEIKDLIFRYGDRGSSENLPVPDLTTLLSSLSNRPESPPEAGADAQLDSWEKIKASLLGGQTVSEAPSALVADRLPAREPDRESSRAVLPTPLPEIDHSRIIDLLGLELPPLVDFETATEDELAEAIQSRDEIISVLLDRISQLHENSMSSVNLDGLAGFEDEKAAIDDLHHKLNEQLKIAEMKNSIERARLSREQAKLQQKEMLIEKKLLQLGLSTPPDQIADAGKAAKTAKPEAKRGWLHR